MSNEPLSSYEQMFKKKTHKIIKDAYVLSLDYLPSALIGRNSEVDRLAEMFSPLEFKGYPANCLIYGKSGSGKTVTIKFFMTKLLEMLEARRCLDHPLVCVYVSCKTHRSSNAVLFDIISQIDPLTTIPRKGFPLDYYYAALWQLIRERNVSIVVVLDEIDQLKQNDVLYMLSRAGESKLLPTRHFITTVGVSNDLLYGDKMDSRTKSSMGFKDVKFDPYNSEQIEMILADRAKSAFYDGAIAEETVNLCAVISARVHGDARKAIDLLKSAATYAEKNCFSRVLPEHIDKAVEILEEDKILSFVDTLPLHDKLVLLAASKLIDSKRVSTDSVKVTSVYNELCKIIEEAPQARSTIANKLREFATMQIIKDTPTKRGKGGRTVQLNVVASALADALCEDDRFEKLCSYRAIGFF
jgi:archaeal cell division control protein 6